MNLDIIELFLRLSSGSPAGPEEHSKQQSPKLIYLLSDYFKKLYLLLAVLNLLHKDITVLKGEGFQADKVLSLVKSSDTTRIYSFYNKQATQRS